MGQRLRKSWELGYAWIFSVYLLVVFRYIPAYVQRTLTEISYTSYRKSHEIFRKYLEISAHMLEIPKSLEILGEISAKSIQKIFWRNCLKIYSRARDNLCSSPEYESLTLRKSPRFLREGKRSVRLEIRDFRLECAESIVKSTEAACVSEELCRWKKLDKSCV